MKRYLRHSIKNACLPVAILSAICFIIYASVLSTMSLTSFGGGVARNTNVHLIYIQLIILSYVAPVVAFSFQMKKTAVDCYFALPLKKTKLYFVATLVGLFYVFVPFTVSYWGGFFTLLLRPENLFEMTAYLPGYLGGLFFGICFFGANAFAFTRANNVLDGVILMIAYSFAVWLALLYVQQLTHVRFPRSVMESSLQFMALNAFADGIQNMIIGRTLDFSWWVIIFPLSYAVLGYFLLFITLPLKKGEQAEQISDSYMSYKSVIPFFTATILGVAEFSLLNLYLVSVGTVVVTLIYSRKWRMNWRSWVLIGVSIGLGLLLHILVGIGNLPIVNPPSEMLLPLQGV
jgi:hypothetical protein